MIDPTNPTVIRVEDDLSTSRSNILSFPMHRTHHKSQKHTISSGPIVVTSPRFLVSPALEDGYCLARLACFEAEERGEPLLLTEEDYSRVIEEYLPDGMTSTEKHEWRCGFILGWASLVLAV